MSLDSYSLSLHRLPRASLLLPHAEGDQIAWSTQQYLAGDLEELATLLMVHVARQLEASAQQQYCVIASEDPVVVLISCLAAWRAGAAVILPNNLRLSTVARLRAQPSSEREQGRPHALLDDHSFEAAMKNRARGLSSGVIPSSINPRDELKAEELALICYTSGSTGQPQACRKLTRQLLGEAQLLAQLFFADLRGPVACSVPAYHLYGVLFSCLAPFLAGLPLVGAVASLEGRPAAPPPLRRLVETDRAQALVSVPAHLHAVLGTDPGLLGGLVRVFSSAAPLPAEVGRGILGLNPAPELIEAWGSTETGGVATRRNQPGGSWVPLPGVLVERDPSSDRLRLYSPFTYEGARVGYLTADRIEPTPEGFIHRGRDDGVLKVGGKRISLQDLESCALSHPKVVDVACLAEQAKGIRNQRVLMVAQSQDPHFTPRELLAHIALHFDDVVLPRKLRVVPQLPRTKTGKILKEDLLALFASGPMQATFGPALSHFKSSLEQAGFIDFAKGHSESAEGRDTFVYELCTCAEQVWFRGHFRHTPLLPGVVQLRSLVLKAAQILWPDLGELSALSRVKFKRPILPDDQLRVSLTRDSAKRTVHFSISWLESRATTASPLEVMLPQVFQLEAPVEASSGVLTFKRSS